MKEEEVRTQSKKKKKNTKQNCKKEEEEGHSRLRKARHKDVIMLDKIVDMIKAKSPIQYQYVSTKNPRDFKTATPRPCKSYNT